MTEAKTGTGNEKLVVEIVGAHNLMPKDGEGSSSPFVEVEFENQRLRSKVKPKDLNPIWNEKLVFHVIDVNDLRHKTLEISVYSEKRSSNSRNFLGKVRVLGSSVGREGESVVQLYTLEKRSLFSSVRGEISVKHYMTTTGENGENVRRVNGSGGSKKSKKVQNLSSSMAIQQQQQQQQQIALHNHNKGNQQQSQQNGQGQRMLPFYPNQGEIKPLVITALPGPMPGPRPVVYSNGSSEFSLKETKPCLGGTGTGVGGLTNHKDKTSSTYDLVEQMQYLYVRIVKAKDLSVSGEVVSEVKLGNYRGVTKKVSLNSSNPEWNQVFAFSKESIQSSVVELFVKEGNKDEYTGRVWFDLSEIPTRVPPDSPLAPQWYKIENRNGGRSNGEIMVSVWFGTQADEAFAEAWHSKAGNVHIEGLSSIKSKVYLSPKLWYLRVSVIEAQDVAIMDKGSGLMRFPELSAKLQVGSQILRTPVASTSPTQSFSNPYWNEDLMFVVAEPFEDCITIVVEDRLGGGALGGQNDVAVGRVQIPVSAVERRTGDTPVGSRWFSLDNGNNNNRFGSRIHLRLSLDGGYHVLDEATMYSSDVRPTAKEL
ncbi:FT-interacting protein 1, partial [Arabidopsis lyrata subsp. lyrata]|uniref:FT-interacting protein 1 n=1 Tax=Arabidopsis lyrata subsp. lyrata TaxID=81972 RepID=UPI000A29C74E